jgi:hypothetical protein
MPISVFNTLKEQLKDVNYNILQSSGDGETFRNPFYLDYIEQLKGIHPDKPIWIYNNFSEFNKKRVDRVLKHKYFERIHTRVDSLIPWIFKKSSDLDMSQVFDNIKYFLSKNEDTPFVILYNNIADYYRRCQSVLHVKPIRDRFNNEELAEVPEEKDAILRYFQKFAKRPELIIMCKINHGLWGERYRTDVNHNPNYRCPKINVIEKVCWIYPNGNIGMCCYEDKQKEEFSLGNIKNEHILDIFYGKKRQEAIRKIKANEFPDYPCNNPRLCGFGDGQEPK